MRARLTLRDDNGTVLAEYLTDVVDDIKVFPSGTNNGFSKTHIKCISREIYNCAEILLVGEDGKLSNVSLRGSSS